MKSELSFHENYHEVDLMISRNSKFVGEKQLANCKICNIFEIRNFVVIRNRDVWIFPKNDNFAETTLNPS